MKKTRKALLSSVFALLMCITMLIGATFAWFTDNATSSSNIIKSGNLDLKMYWTDSLTGGQWYDVEDPKHNTIFNYDNWEPGYTDVRYIKIVNNGNLAFNYNLAITPVGEVGKLAEVINVFYGTDKNGIQVNSIDDLNSLNSIGLLQSVLNGRSTANGTLLAKGQSSPLHNSGEEIITIAMNMITTAGNEYQGKSVGDGFEITALATQTSYEKDSFGSSYDGSATYPDIVSEGQVSSTVSTENGKVASGGIELIGDGFSAEVPEGVELEKGIDRLTLTVTPLEESATDITTVNQEILIPVDVHVSGVSENNTTPIIVNLGAVMPKHLNMGNYTLYHVEDGENVTMTYIGLDEEFTAHNQFKYDPMTGELTLAMVSFSEVAILADEENAWNGNKEEFSDGTGTEADPYIIANADQLAYMGDKVSNDNETYGNKHYKLIADINIGGDEAKDLNGNPVIWYPIGYNKVGGEVATVSLDEIYFEPINSAQPGDKDGDVVATIGENSWYTYGGAFKGIFDGNGHTISNIYQNTWAMKGNYDGHYYNAAMGLFGYVHGGTVKNLTINNFQSQGEFAPTGCVTAYADGTEVKPATFENISITNSHPQTYNTGVAGVVGWNNADGMFLNFKNITVDETNTISALWGSWDVAASGILGSLKTNSHANFDNCHVAATIDVYNDVCGNYQYYWYRYSGAFIGTVYRRLDNGNGALDLKNVEAKDCTVNFGDRHQYYYCEFEKNTQASYTEDYQFSRVPHDELNMEENPVTCKHTHTDKEDKQAVYLPYAQLFGGYGWGVNGIDLDKYQEQYGTTIDITDYTTSVTKFDKAEKAKDEYTTGTEVKIGELFKTVEGIEVEIKKNNVKVFVSPVGEDSNVSAEYIQDPKDWTQGTLKFNGLGRATITITDYYFCEATTIDVTITERKDVEKFETKFNNAYTYRVGNANTVSLVSLFKTVDGATIVNENVNVTISNVKGSANGTYTVNTSDWRKGTIQFTGTGLVELTITDNDYCTPTTLELEVVDAVNATSATSATKNNVVLLQDVGLHTIEVSGGYTLYGNGFKMTAENDVMYDAMNAGFVVLKNGTLDNVQVICPNFSHAVVYKSNITEDANTAKPDDSSNDARGNVRSAVMVDGNSKIVNSYVHGGRAAIFLRSGNLIVDGSTISGGAAANIHTMSAQSLTLRNATLIQKPYQATVNDTSKTLMGFSGLFECDENGDATPLILEGTLVQNAWINESYKQYAPSAASSIISAALGKTDYLHDLDGDGKNESLNLGFTYIPQNSGGSTKANVTDNRTNKDVVPYDSVDVGSVMASAKVYSYKNSNGTDAGFETGEFSPSAQGATTPTILFTDANADRVFETKFDSSDNRWESSLTVNLDNGNYTFDFNKLLVQKYGENLNYTVQREDGTIVDTSKTISLSSSSVTTYVLTVADDGVTHTFYFVLTATKTSIPEPVVADKTGGTPLLVVKSKNSDWSCAIPALEGIMIKYYTTDGETTLDLATLTPTSKGKQNGTNNYWETTKDGYKLKVSCGVIHDTKQVYGMPVVVDNNGTNQMYFTISSTNGYVSTGTSARSVTVTYEFTDPNGKALTFTKSWNVKYADYKDDAQYSYSDFVNGTMTDLLTSSSSGSTCVTPDTLITLADGSKVRVDSLTGSEQLLVWNMETGSLDSAPIMFVDSDPKATYEVIKLYFSDGTEVKVISEHGFWDYDLNRYVYLDRDAEQYIGHTFAKQNGDVLEKVELVDVVFENQVTTAWSPVTAGHLCYFVNDMLSMPGGVGGLFNIFDVDAETMTYDYEAMARDIEMYGLFTYEELSQYAELSKDMFDAAGGQYLKVSIGKGNLTEEELIAMIERYSKYFE